MNSLKRFLSRCNLPLPHPRPWPLSSSASTLSTAPATTSARRPFSSRGCLPPNSSATTGDDEWNDAWEMSWLPEDPSTKDIAPWESATAPTAADSLDLPADVDTDTKAFVAEMDDRWNERRSARRQQPVRQQSVEQVEGGKGVASKKAAGDYRMRKQRIHAGLWVKEIEKMEEAKLGGPDASDDIDRLLDSCSEIFDSGNIDLNGSKVPSISELKAKPDGWETSSKNADGNIWEISQREEDILLQEFERRIAFSKHQIASFIKTHIFSRRRPIDGWRYMIEVIGPNARRGKGSVQRLPSFTDPSTLSYKEERQSIGPTVNSFRGSSSSKY